MTTRVIALDLDGTLLTPKKTLLPSSIEALARAREAGYQLIIVTGRHHVAIHPDILTKYNTDHAILDVAELDGLLTAVLSSPQEIEPAQWLVAVWGGADYVPRWASEKEMTRFMNLAFQHMADTAERLNEFPEQFEPLFGLREVDGSELTIVEEWCFGYMRGVALSDWSTLPDSLKPALEAIALHGTEENFERVEKMSPEAFEESVDAIRLAALDLHAYWMAHPQEKAVQQPIKAEEKPGRNDPCPCGSGKKFKQCCLH